LLKLLINKHTAVFYWNRFHILFPFLQLWMAFNMDGKNAQLLYSRLVSIMKILNEVQQLELEAEKCAEDADNSSSSQNAVTDDSKPINNKVESVQQAVVTYNNRQTVSVSTNINIPIQSLLTCIPGAKVTPRYIGHRWLPPVLHL